MKTSEKIDNILREAIRLSDEIIYIFEDKNIDMMDEITEYFYEKFNNYKKGI